MESIQQNQINVKIPHSFEDSIISLSHEPKLDEDNISPFSCRTNTSSTSCCHPLDCDAKLSCDYTFGACHYFSMHRDKFEGSGSFGASSIGPWCWTKRKCIGAKRLVIASAIKVDSSLLFVQKTMYNVLLSGSHDSAQYVFMAK